MTNPIPEMTAKETWKACHRAVAKMARLAFKFVK